MAAPENQNPTPQAQPEVKADPQVPVAPKKKTNGLLIVLIVTAIVWIGTAAGVVYLFMQNRTLRQEFANRAPAEEEMATSSPTATPNLKNTLVSVDDTWNLYTNYDLGFSMNVPKTMYHGYGECEFKQNESSYRPRLAAVPVKIFENQNKIFITGEYYYSLAEERVEADIHYYDACNKLTNTAADFEDQDNFQQQGWEIIAGDASNDAELETFIKENYGSGCKVGEKTESDQAGVFDVKVDAGSYENLEDAEAAGCLVNYLYELKYAPEKERVITWTVGQAYSFYKDDSYDAYDEDMIASFKMLLSQ